jgi:hypothetical protein
MRQSLEEYELRCPYGTSVSLTGDPSYLSCAITVGVEYIQLTRKESHRGWKNLGGAAMLEDTPLRPDFRAAVCAFPKNGLIKADLLHNLEVPPGGPELGHIFLPSCFGVAEI